MSILADALASRWKKFDGMEMERHYSCDVRQSSHIGVSVYRRVQSELAPHQPSC